MKAKRNHNFIHKLLLAASLSCAVLPAWGQGLPEGEGLQVIVASCTQCHGLDRLTDIRLSAMQWENALYDMIARGAVVEGKDLSVVRKYLIDSFAVDQK